MLYARWLISQGCEVTLRITWINRRHHILSSVYGEVRINRIKEANKVRKR
jgi:hypothetical protein